MNFATKRSHRSFLEDTSLEEAASKEHRVKYRALKSHHIELPLPLPRFQFRSRAHRVRDKLDISNRSTRTYRSAAVVLSGFGDISRLQI